MLVTEQVPTAAESRGPVCCPTGLTAPLDRETAEDLARLLKAVADPARLQLLALLKASAAGEACVCDLTGPLGLSQPTVSHHLKVLTEAGAADPGEARHLGVVLHRPRSARRDRRRPALTFAGPMGRSTMEVLTDRTPVAHESPAS